MAKPCILPCFAFLDALDLFVSRGVVVTAEIDCMSIRGRWVVGACLSDEISTSFWLAWARNTLSTVLSASPPPWSAIWLRHPTQDGRDNHSVGPVNRAPHCCNSDVGGAEGELSGCSLRRSCGESSRSFGAGRRSIPWLVIACVTYVS